MQLDLTSDDEIMFAAVVVVCVLTLGESDHANLLAATTPLASVSTAQHLRATTPPSMMTTTAATTTTEPAVGVSIVAAASPRQAFTGFGFSMVREAGRAALMYNVSADARERILSLLVEGLGSNVLRLWWTPPEPLAGQVAGPQQSIKLLICSFSNHIFNVRLRFSDFSLFRDETCRHNKRRRNLSRELR